MILYRLFKNAGADFNLELAQPLYAGIVGDTGVSACQHYYRSISGAADLTAQGAVPHLTAEAIFATKPLAVDPFSRICPYQN